MASKLDSREIDEILQATRDNVAEWTHAMSEELFVSYFLPAFRSKDIPKEMARARLIEFARGAGGMNMPVNIKSPSGEILFQVPPLQSTMHMSQKRGFENSDVSFTELLARVSNLYDYSHAQGDAMLKQKVLERVKKMVDPTNPKWQQSVAQWQAIFARYPIEPGPEAVAEQTPAPQPAAQTQVDDSDFEGSF